VPFEIVRNDITKMRTDAIVNATNSRLDMDGGGVSAQIYKAACENLMRKATEVIGHCEPGSSVITKGYNLPAKYVIHSVGPIWQGGNKNEEELLSSTYRSALEIAKRNNLETIAFPLLSSGTFGFPKDKALKIATDTITDFLLENEMTVYLVVFDRKAFSLSEKLFKSIKEYITDSYIIDANIYRPKDREMRYRMEISREASIEGPVYSDSSFDDIIQNKELSFSQYLLTLIDKRGKTDPEVYKKANIDRKHFSKIRNNPDYKPSKNTALALCIALELNLDQTADLLKRAGLALSPSDNFDLIVEYFIKNNNYDIFQINEALFSFNQSTLGG
jgi:O-acetyl-ADP-ribose deacetylase (regulator of RNase III)